MITKEYIAVLRLVWLLTCTCYCAGQQLNEAVTCFPTWNRNDGHQSIDGTKSEASTVQDCLEYCERYKPCLAVDFGRSDSTCWMHTNSSYSNQENTYEDSTVDQYTIYRNCTNQKVQVMDCPDSWQTVSSKDTISTTVNFNYSFSSCMTNCRFVDSCQGFVYDNSTWPPCKIFSNKEVTSSKNIFYNTNANLYLINKSNCLKERRTYGRCHGQSFPPASQWCPLGQDLAIIGKYYKPHPLCCPGSGNTTIFPLDNVDLPSYDIELINSSYYSHVNNCLSNASCILRAQKSSVSSTLNQYCPSKTEFQYVAVTFECKGPATPATSQLQQNNQDRTALVLGAIGTAFGILCLLLILGFLVYYFCCIRRSETLDNYVQSRTKVDRVDASGESESVASTEKYEQSYGGKANNVLSADNGVEEYLYKNGRESINSSTLAF